MGVLGPGFGGFLATFITPQLFKEKDASSITTSFISVVVTLGIVMGMVSLLVVKQEKSGIGELVLFVIHVSAIVVGAKIGKSLYVPKNA